MKTNSQFCRRLLAVLVSGILATTAWCASGTWTDHYNTTWTFDYSGADATITGAADYWPTVVVPEKVYVGSSPYTVKHIGNQVFDATVDAKASTIQRVVIPSTVETIGERAFYGCSGLVNAGFNDGLKTIKADAFKNAVNLPGVVIPASVDVIEDGAFSGCGALDSVEFGGNAGAIWCDDTFTEKMHGAAVFASTPFITLANVNDNFTGAIELTVGSGRTSGCNIFATAESGDLLGNRSLWWKWTAPAGVKKAVFYTYGSSFWTRLGVYKGTALDALTAVAVGSNRLSDYTSFVPFDAEPGQTYYICVTGSSISQSGTVKLGWMSAGGFALVVQDEALLGFIGACQASVTIPDGVTVIEQNAFAKDSDASVVNLTSVEIPGSVVKIGKWAFWNCSNLSSVTFEDPEVSVEISEIPQTFYGTPYLASLYANDNWGVNGANAIEITGASGAVMGWNVNATSETGEPADTENHSLWWKWKPPAGVKKAVFHTYGSDFNTVLGVYKGSTLATLSGPYNDNADASWIGNDKASWMEIDVAPSVEYYYICVGSSDPAESGTVKFGWEACGDGGSSLVTWGDALLGFVGTCPASVVVPDGITLIEKSAFDHDYFAVDNLKSVVIPESVERIGNWAFYQCPQLASVKFEGDALGIEMDYSKAFQDTPFLAKVNENDHWANAIELTGAKGSVTAWNAFATPEVDEPLEDAVHTLWWKWTPPAGVTKVMFHTYGSAFDTLLGVYTGTAVDALTEVALNDDRGGTTSLVSFDVTPSETYYICVSGYSDTAGGDVKLTWEAANEFSLIIEDGVVLGFLGKCPASLVIPSTVTMIGESAFDYYCDDTVLNLTSLVIPGSVTNIGYAAFSECEHLTSVTFNEGLRMIDGDAFWGCLGLAGQTFILPTTLEEIDEDAFENVGGELTLDLPRSLNGTLASGSVGTTDLTVRYYVKATLDPNGGVLANRVRMIYGDVYGDLSPLPTRTGYTFKGWKNGNTAITAATALPDVATVTLTAQWEVIKKTVTLDFGGQIVVDYGTKVGDLPKPARDHYAFIGWSTADGTLLPDDTPVTSDLQLFAKWKALYYLYATAGEAVPAVASTYDGYLYKGEELAGTITVKVGKPNKAGLSSVKATVVLAGGKVTLKTAGKGTAMSKDAPTTVTLTGGAACEVTLGSDGMKGTYGEYGIDGARNVFVSKDAQDRSVAEKALSAWRGTVNVAWQGANGWNGLSVSIANKGKASVSGSLADGTKVTAKSQVIVGEEWCCVPVLVTRKANLAFLLWLPLDGSAKPGTLGLGEGVKADKPGLLKGDQAAFHIDSTAFTAMWGKSALPYLPDGVTVKGGQQWGLPKAGKVTYESGSTTVDAAKLQDNPAALKLKFKSKNGTFSGSFKAYVDVNGKLKATTVAVSGVLVNGVGYGTATIKKVGSVPVTVE